MRKLLLQFVILFILACLAIPLTTAAQSPDEPVVRAVLFYSPICSARKPLPYAKTWAIPILALVGLGIATYLAYVEIAHVEAVYGPIGRCNFVQSSPYAHILGIPVAALGVLYYLAVGVLWAGQRSPTRQRANRSVLGLLGLTLFGTLFSIYLTSLELFVVRAACTWCLGSAVATTMLRG